MSKVLSIIPELCTSCHRCEMWCSMVKHGETNPARSNIYVIRREPGIDVPVICTQCGLCVDACPTNALKRNLSTGAIEVNQELCTGCETCIGVCPNGVLRIDIVTGIASKCDLCKGSPVCAEKCEHKALKYEDVEKASARRREQWAKANSKNKIK